MHMLWISDSMPNETMFFFPLMISSPLICQTCAWPQHRTCASHKVSDPEIPALAFFVTDYCEYGPINQDLDPCSRVYDPKLKMSCAVHFLRFSGTNRSCKWLVIACDSLWWLNGVMILMILLEWLHFPLCLCAWQWSDMSEAEQMYDINHHLCRLVTKECKSATCESNSEII